MNVDNEPSTSVTQDLFLLFLLFSFSLMCYLTDGMALPCFLKLDGVFGVGSPVGK